MAHFATDSNLIPAKTYFCGFFVPKTKKSKNFSKKMKIICKKFGKYKIPPYLCVKKSNKHTQTNFQKQKTQVSWQRKLHQQLARFSTLNF